ncbi:LysE family translocator [Aestuariivirga sp. YIM B02566]|uniref:LysE family translocator n=1 Tax=Taklimakanibacter albus TaxID=2800327 RepID=A0ACC5R2S5_9HYPH|nr:LysE family translocator [Aestuariivirga sp. YIM B02566]MBK1866913.1 LysE family translocator [Aestuariivirga sp. YIM B02566]
MTLEAYIAFCIAAIAIVIVPGPTVTIIIANSLKHGTRAGLLNVAGTQAGLLVWMAIAIAGLASAITYMGVWFDVLRIAGAAYLIWLGIKLIRSKGQLTAAAATAPRGGFFFQGFVVILSNPKVLLVFGALIPQFISKDGDYPNQLVLLGLSFMVIATVFDSLYAFAAGNAGSWLSQKRVRFVEVSSGLCLIGGGLWLALRGR